MTLNDFLNSTGMSQRAFAKIVGITQAHVSRLCTGTVPSFSLAIRIQKATDNKVGMDAWANPAPTKEAAQ